MQASSMIQKKAQGLESEGRVGIPARSLSSPGSGWTFLLSQIHCLPCSVPQGLTSVDCLPRLPCHLSPARPKEEWNQAGDRGPGFFPAARGRAAAVHPGPSAPLSAVRPRWSRNTRPSLRPCGLDVSLRLLSGQLNVPCLL